MKDSTMTNPSYTIQLNELLQKFNPEDPESLNELLVFTQERLRAIIHNKLSDDKYVHRWSQTDDVYQNIAIRLSRAIKETLPKTKKDYFSLAVTCIQREIVDLARQFRNGNSFESNHGTSQKNTSDNDRENSLWEGQIDDESLQYIEYHDAVDFALEKLQEEQRQLIKFMYYENLTSKEIAALYEISESTVKRRINDAKLRLCEILEVQGYVL